MRITMLLIGGSYGIGLSLVDTPFPKRWLNNDRKQEAKAQRHPLKRVGKDEDIAHTALFLISKKNGWMTGQVLRVDGGLSALNLS